MCAFRSRGEAQAIRRLCPSRTRALTDPARPPARKSLHNTAELEADPALTGCRN